jgi:hypothetical protein
MKLPFNLSSMEVHKAPESTPKEIAEYKGEDDHDKRINLAYEYRIKSEDLYLEDLKEILDDMYTGMEEL